MRLSNYLPVGELPPANNPVQSFCLVIIEASLPRGALAIWFSW
jgi:hypothetical protein